MDAGQKESVITQIHQIYIRATPEAIWEAITSPEWNAPSESRRSTSKDKGFKERKERVLKSAC